MYSRNIALAVIVYLAVVVPAAAFQKAPDNTVQRRTAAAAAAPALGPDLAREMQRLAAASSVWKENDSDYRKQRAAGRLSGADADDYAAYVAELKRNVLVACDRVRRAGGTGDLKDYGCSELPPPAAAGQAGDGKPGGSKAADRGEGTAADSASGEAARAAGAPAGTDGAVAALPPDPESVKTEGESAASLEAALRKVEGDLDELTRRTEREARQRSGAVGAGGSGGAGAGGASGGGSQGARAGTDGQGGQSGVNGAQGADRNESGSRTANKNNEQERSGQGGGSASSPSAGDRAGTAGREAAGALPSRPRPDDRAARSDEGPGVSGTDDDVVARQLREAAEQEPDPALKKKLWAEYRKYKEAQQ